MNTNKHHPVIEPGTVVAGVTLKMAMNAKRIRVLTRRKCSLFVDGGDGLAGAEAAFFCLSLSSDELQALYGLTQEQWDEMVGDFAEALPDGGLEEFVSLFKEEEEMIQAVSVEADDDEGKAKGGQTAEPPPIGSQASSPQPLKAVSDMAKRNPSPSSASCNTSTPSAMPTASGFVGEGAEETIPRAVFYDD